MKSILKYFGGKFYLAKWIVSYFPEHVTYVEPFFGAGNVLLQKPPSKIEIVNDIDPIIYAVWRTIKDDPEQLVKHLKEIRHNKQTFEKFKHFESEHRGYTAVREIVLTRMSRSADRKSYQDSTRLRRDMPEAESAWLSAVESIPPLAERMKLVGVFNGEAIECITQLNKPTTLIYCDPPYHPATRVSGGYRHEMNHAQHVEFLDCVLRSKSKIAISGYDCYTYRTMLKDWNVKYKDIVNHASQKANKEIKREMLWMNY